MMKKLFMVIGAVVAVVVLIVIVAGVIIYIKVDKTFVASRMSQALNRQVYIDRVDVGIFSVLSGIEISNAAISNFKTPEELARVQGKPLAAQDVFAGMEAFRFKVKILPLLSRRIELKELVLYSPVINLFKSRQGAMNIDDLIQSKKPEQPREAKAAKPSAPLSADAIPIAIAVGEIGMKNGTVNYHDAEYDQSVQIYNMTALAYDIAIDPKDLEHQDEVKLRLSMGARSVGAMKTGAVRNFDVTLTATGRVIPFDAKTRLLDPQALLHIQLPDGEISGLQIFNAVAAIPILGDYLGQHLSFLRDKQQWKGSDKSGLDLTYKAANVRIANGRLDLKEAGLLFDGGMNLDSKAVDLNLDVVMKKEINEAVRKSLAEKIESAIRNPEVKKYADSGKLADIAMKPLVNPDGLIDLKVKVGGTTKKPDAKLTHPQLGSLDKIVKDHVGELAVEAGKGAARQLLKQDQQKVLDDIEGLFKKK